jgi:LDH2 family malate/lactate/ureidoglycolate dehydrogenase
LTLALAAAVLHWDRQSLKQARIVMDQIASPTRVTASAIAGFIQDTLAKMGLPAGDAAKVAELMTEADLTGADAHGVFRLPQYVRRLRTGGVNPRPAIKVSRQPPWWTVTTAWDTW